MADFNASIFCKHFNVCHGWDTRPGRDTTTRRIDHTAKKHDCALCLFHSPYVSAFSRYSDSIQSILHRHQRSCHIRRIGCFIRDCRTDKRIQGKETNYILTRAAVFHFDR